VQDASGDGAYDFQGQKKGREKKTRSEAGGREGEDCSSRRVLAREKGRGNRQKKSLTKRSKEGEEENI